MSSTVNGTESESTGVGFSVSSNHIVDLVHSPFLVDIPGHVSDPVLSSNSRDSSIDISRVVEHLVLTLECLIDPLRTLRLNYVVNILSA
jgi:hypothetical protein